MNGHWLIAAGSLSWVAAFLHVCIIIGGPNWYRFFGAGESIATMAEQGLLQPTIITLCIATVLFIWGAYAWSAAGVLPVLPLTTLALVLITAVYLIRGLAGFILPHVSQHPMILANSPTFWFWSSLICTIIAAVHIKAVWGFIQG